MNVEPERGFGSRLLRSRLFRTFVIFNVVMIGLIVVAVSVPVDPNADQTTAEMTKAAEFVVLFLIGLVGDLIMAIIATVRGIRRRRKKRRQSLLKEEPT